MEFPHLGKHCYQKDCKQLGLYIYNENQYKFNYQRVGIIMPLMGGVYWDIFFFNEWNNIQCYCITESCYYLYNYKYVTNYSIASFLGRSAK